MSCLVFQAGYLRKILTLSGLRGTERMIGMARAVCVTRVAWVVPYSLQDALMPFVALDHNLPAVYSLFAFLQCVLISAQCIGVIIDI